MIYLKKIKLNNFAVFSTIQILTIFMVQYETANHNNITGFFFLSLTWDIFSGYGFRNLHAFLLFGLPVKRNLKPEIILAQNTAPPQWLTRSSELLLGKKCLCGSWRWGSGAEAEQKCFCRCQGNDIGFPRRSSEPDSERLKHGHSRLAFFFSSWGVIQSYAE